MHYQAATEGGWQKVSREETVSSDVHDIRQSLSAKDFVQKLKLCYFFEPLKMGDYK